MASVNSYVRKFSGRLDGINIIELSKKLDYTIEDFDKRLEIVNDICNHDFFKEYFDSSDTSFVNHNLAMLEDNKHNMSKDRYKQRQDEIKSKKKSTIYYNVHPRCYSEVYSGDPLAEDNNICQFIERMGSYLLFENKRIDGRKKKEEIYEVTTSNMSEGNGIAKDDKSTQTKRDYNNINDEIYINNMLAEKARRRNFKKEIKQNIIEFDYNLEKQLKIIENKRKNELKNTKKQHEIDKINSIYNDLVHRCREKVNFLKSYKEDYDKLKKIRDKKHNLFERNKYNKLINEIQNNMIMCKDAYDKTIYFKSPLRDSTKPDLYLAPYDSKEVVYNLLFIEKPETYNFQSDLDIMLYDIDCLVKKIDWNNPRFAKQKEIMDYISLGYSQKKISKYIDINEKKLEQYLRPVVNEVAKEYKKQKRDVIFLNYIKGTYKKCSKCGEIKLVQDYSKHSQTNDGLRPNCKSCDN